VFLRMASGTSDPSRVDDVLAALRQAGQPIMRQSAGFQNMYVAADRATGQVVIVSTWDTQEHAGVQFAAPDLIARLQALDVQMEQPKIYEVIDRV
jgi:hypothetical protein